MPEMLSVPMAPPAPSAAHDPAPCAGREPEGPPFKQVLDNHQARTADAEGQKADGDDSPKVTTPETTDGTTPQGDATDPAATPATAIAQALALTLVAPAAPAAAPAPAVAAGTVAEAATPATTAPTAAVLAAVAEAAAGTPAGVTGEQATATPAGTLALPANGTRADGKPAVDPAVAAAPAAAPAPTTTAAAAPAQDAPGQPAAAQPAAAQAAAAPAAEIAGEAKGNQPAAPAAAPAQTPVHAGGPAPAQATPAAAPAAAPSPLNTAQAVERIQAMVHLAHARGAAHARIELHPAELGGVTIQLQLAHDGLRAHIAADRPEALPLLQRAAAELQRSLESRGIDLSGLDFGLAPDAEAGASRDDARAQERQSAFGGPGPIGADDESDAVEATVTTTTRTVELPAGALVDVRA